MPDALICQCVDDMEGALAELSSISEAVRSVYFELQQRVKNEESQLHQIIVERGISDRRRLEQAIHAAQAQMKRMRSHIIRVLVEEEGHTLTDVGRLMGISRQAVSQLYQLALNDLRDSWSDGR